MDVDEPVASPRTVWRRKYLINSHEPNPQTHHLQFLVVLFYHTLLVALIHQFSRNYSLLQEIITSKQVCSLLTARLGVFGEDGPEYPSDDDWCKSPLMFTIRHCSFVEALNVTPVAFLIVIDCLASQSVSFCCLPQSFLFHLDWEAKSRHV